MTTSEPTASPAVTSPPVPIASRRCTAERFVLSTESGYLVAGTGIGGIPVVLTPDPLAAVRFTDLDTAALRARHLTKLGWSNLTVTPITVPLF
jgi:hypothetical protein